MDGGLGLLLEESPSYCDVKLAVFHKTRDNGGVSFVVISASHHDLDLADVEQLARRGADIGRQIAGVDGVEGAVTLSTCNRFELYLDAEEHRIDDAVALMKDDLDIDLACMTGMDAARHVYEVASGLDSMVVGEREIVGQVRKALEQARTDGTTTTLLEHTIQGALRTSRAVSMKTDFARAGRSIMAVALDMAGAIACERTQYSWADTDGPTLPTSDWRGVKVLLVGTGAYAGVSVADLRDRGAQDIRVWSASGRGEVFARDHKIDYTPTLDLTWPDVIVLCRGTGSPVLTKDMVEPVMASRGPLTLIDMALSKDVDSSVGQIENVTLIDLEVVRMHVPAATRGDIENAQAIIAEGLNELDSSDLGRTMDPLVVAVRNAYAAELEKELHRLPAAGMIPAEDAVRALQRLAAALVYKPTVAAQKAAKEGRGKAFHEAAELVLNTELPLPAPRRLVETENPDA